MVNCLWRVAHAGKGQMQPLVIIDKHMRVAQAVQQSIRITPVQRQLIWHPPSEGGKGTGPIRCVIKNPFPIKRIKGPTPAEHAEIGAA